MKKERFELFKQKYSESLRYLQGETLTLEQSRELISLLVAGACQVALPGSLWGAEDADSRRIAGSMYADYTDALGLLKKALQ